MGLKIPTIYKKEYVEELDTFTVSNEINPECKWLFEKGGMPFLMVHGLDVLVMNGVIHKRLHVKKNKEKPNNWVKDVDDNSKIKKGKEPGWIPIGSTKDDLFYVEAHINWLKTREIAVPDSYFKLVGPGIHDNRYDLKYRYFVPPFSHVINEDIPLDFVKLFDYMSKTKYAGIVWLKESINVFAQKAKIERKDFLFF